MEITRIISNLKDSYIIAIIAIVSLVIYAQTISYDYTLDDAIAIYENVHTQAGVSGMKDLLTHDSFHGFFRDESKAGLVTGGRYRPLSMLCFALEYEIAGNNPWLSHLMNILWYIFNGLIIFFVSRMMVRRKFANHATLIAFLVSIIFIVHPLHVEAVANIKGRDEIMAMTLSLSAIYVLFRQIQSFSILKFLSIFILSFAAAMSKENALFLLSLSPIFVMIAYDKSWMESLKTSLPVILGSLLYLALRYIVLGMDFSSESSELMNNPFLTYDGSQLIPMNMSEKAASIIYGLGYYLKLLIYPYPLSHDYYPHVFPVLSMISWQVILAIILHIGMVFASIISWKKNKLISLGILIYLWCLLPVSNIFFPIGTHISERFLYISSYGMILTIVTVTLSPKLLSSPSKGKVRIVLLLLISLLLGLMSIMRTPVWKNNETLFLTDVEHRPESAKLQNAAGGVLTDKATKTDDKAASKNFATKAITHLNKAIEIHPLYKSPYLIRGIAYLQLDEYDKSIADLEYVYQMNPGDQDIFEKLVYALRSAGRYVGEEEKNVEKAIFYLKKAEKLKPSDPETIRLLGVAYGVSNNDRKAISYFKKNLNNDPQNAQMHLNIAIGYTRMGMQDSAQIHFDAAEKLEPGILNKEKN